MYPFARAPSPSWSAWARGRWSTSSATSWPTPRTSGSSGPSTTRSILYTSPERGLRRLTVRKWKGCVNYESIVPWLLSGTRSRLTYTPRDNKDYGTLMCMASNVVGNQKEPCIFHIILAGNTLWKTVALEKKLVAFVGRETCAVFREIYEQADLILYCPWLRQTTDEIIAACPSLLQKLERQCWLLRVRHKIGEFANKTKGFVKMFILEYCAVTGFVVPFFWGGVLGRAKTFFWERHFSAECCSKVPD